MARFQFKLESVEKVRNIQEQKALEEVAICQAKYQEKISEKNQLLAKKKQAFIEKNELFSKDCSVETIRLHEEYWVGLQQRLIRADQAIVRARRFLDQAMRVYLKARRDHKMMNQLKDQAALDFKVAHGREEQKKLDDLISMRERLNHGPLSSHDHEDEDFTG